MDVGQFVLEDLQASINRALFANPLGETDDPVKSATEQMLRTQEMLRSSGASFGRLNTEKIKAVVARAVDILSTNGRLPKFKVDGKEVSIRMQSPLAKAEEQEEFQAFQVWWAQMQTLPEEVVALGAQVENIPAWTAAKLGLPVADLARSSEEIKAASKQIIEQAQTQQGAQQPQQQEM
tara:strand:- start:275 stop:811 length:537 start_codon:yes stop_codon:yes gene_type:complete